MADQCKTPPVSPADQSSGTTTAASPVPGDASRQPASITELQERLGHLHISSAPSSSSSPAVTVAEGDSNASMVSLEVSFDQKRPNSLQTGIIYEEGLMVEHRCLWDPQHLERPERLTSTLSRIREWDLEKHCLRLPTRAATREELLLAHSSEYVDKISATSGIVDENHLESASSQFDCVYIHPATYEAAVLSAGSSIALVDAILDDRVRNGFALVRPPGHHAQESAANGFCLFNNAAIAAKHAVENRGLRRVLLVDWDVHHGQGTQYAFYSDPRVLFASVHRYEEGAFWPELIESNYDSIGSGRGRGFNVNVPLNEIGMRDADYLAIWHNLLLPIAYEYQPELVIVSAGYDAALGCPEGEMRLSPALFAHLTHSLMALSAGRVCVLLEGGYCIPSLSESAAHTLRALTGCPPPSLASFQLWPQRVLKKTLIETILSCIWALKPHWKCLRVQTEFDRVKFPLPDDSNQTQKVREDEYDAQQELESCPFLSRHYPVVQYLGQVALRPPPDSYPTRSTCPEQSPEVKEAIRRDLSILEQRTSLKVPENILNGASQARTCLVYDDAMLKHKNTEDRGHPERPHRIRSIWKALASAALRDRCKILESREATQQELELIHSKEYLNTLRATKTMPDDKLRKLSSSYNSIYLMRDSLDAALLAAGSLLQMVDEVMGGRSLNGFACIRPPGHHAAAGLASGFCLVNNVALAAKYALDRYPDTVRRVLIFDWDVHHGDGTQEIVADDPERILYLSTHRYEFADFFPSTIQSGVYQHGRANVVNIPWNGGDKTDWDYMTAFLNIILPVATHFQPDLVLISAGFDAARGDPLGHYCLSPQIYGHMTHHLCSLASGKVIAALEGGYNLTSISESACRVVAALLGDPLEPLSGHKDSGSSSSATATDTDTLPLTEDSLQVIRQVVAHQRSHWPALAFGVQLPENKLIE